MREGVGYRTWLESQARARRGKPSERLPLSWHSSPLLHPGYTFIPGSPLHHQETAPCTIQNALAFHVVSSTTQHQLSSRATPAPSTVHSHHMQPMHCPECTLVPRRSPCFEKPLSNRFEKPCEKARPFETPPRQVFGPVSHLLKPACMVLGFRHVWALSCCDLGRWALGRSNHPQPFHRRAGRVCT